MKNKETKLPAYTQMVYGDIYNNLDKSNARDTKFSANLRTFFYYNKLVDSALYKIKTHQSVLQMGLVFGDEIDRVAQRIGAYGEFDILDINGLQVSRNKEKYGNIYPCLHIFEQDVATIDIHEQYDNVLCFLLLQELPPATKAKVINNALNAVKPGGSVIFVDYHKPRFWHPLSYVVRMHNRLYHPFAEKLWDKGIESYAHNRSSFSWHKSTYFGGMFQRLIATRKINPLETTFIADTHPKDKAYLPDF